MWRSSYILPFLLLVLAGPARAEEVDAPTENLDPARVAKLLLSGDEDERARGAALLRLRMQRGGDTQTWLVAMARAQAEWADADERLIEHWIDDVLRGTPARAVRARRLLAALGRDATRRLLQALRDVQALLPQTAGLARQSGEAAPLTPAPGQLAGSQNDEQPPPPREPTTPQAPVTVTRVPVGRIDAEVLEVPSTEILASLATDQRAYGASVRDLQPIAHEQAVVVPAGTVFRNAAALPEARIRPVLPSRGLVAPGRPLVLVEGDALRYRSRVRRTKGAWAVDTDTLRRGLQVSVRLGTGKQAGLLEIEARYVSLPDPLPTEQVRPAGDVEPLELDRPEWESASLTLGTPLEAARAEVVAFFPGLVPDKVVVVRLRLLPLTAEAAAREQAK